MKRKHRRGSRSRQTVAFGLATMLIGALWAPDAAARPMNVRHLQAIPSLDPGGLCEPPHVELEAHVAVNPIDPTNILVTWTVDGNRAIGVARSVDGGFSWSIVPMEALNGCAVASGRANFVESWLSFGVTDYGDAIAYLSLHALPGRYGSEEALVLTSVDGGSTWSDPYVVKSEDVTEDPLVGHGPRVTAHPTRPCSAYVVWTSGTTTLEPIDDESQVFFAKTTDCGVSWSDPRSIVSATPSFGRGTRGRQILVHPDGTLILFFYWNDKTGGAPGVDQSLPIMAQTSNDDGETWSDPVQLGTATRDRLLDPDGQPVQQAEPGPTGGVGPDGTVYVVWADNEQSLLLSQSDDAGQNWSDPVPIITEENGVFIPTLAVAPDGTVGITYYDFRYDKSEDADGDGTDDELTTDVWFAHADRGRMSSWEETRVAGPFDARTVAEGNSQGFGEHAGLVSLGSGFAAAFVMGQPLPTDETGEPEPIDGSTDVFFAELEQPGGDPRSQ